MARRKLFGRRRSGLVDLGLLALRVTAGGLLAGHGAQKLFGSFEGPGLEGTSKYLESLGLKPGPVWARVAGISELGGGVLTALGFLGPVGPLGIIGVMSMAIATEHAGKPIWVASGGGELPVTNLGIASALILSGHGRYSLDGALGLAVPRWMALPGLLAVGAGLYLGTRPERATIPAREREARARVQAGEQAAQGF